MVGQLSTKELFIWYNKDIKVNNKPVLYKSFYDLGIKYVKHLVKKNGEVIDFKDLGLHQKEWFKWYQINQSIRKSRIFEYDNQDNENQEEYMVGDIKLEKANAKQIYKLFLDKSQNIVPKIRTEKYVEIPRDENLETIFKRCHSNFLDTFTKAFQFKFLNNILVNNYWLKKWKIRENNECTFCNNMNNEENIYHMFWECEITRKFWSDFENWVRQFVPLEITRQLVFYGVDDHLVYTLIILAKIFIYECWKKESKPKIQPYKHKIKYLRKIEFEIARKNKTTDTFIEKWNPLTEF